MLSQRSLLCGCGASKLFARGRCSACYRAHRLSREKFAGLREAALIRDGRCCTQCGTSLQILVHHRRRGENELRWFITSCRRCHPRIHFRRRLPYGVSPHFRMLWRELHRNELEQLELPFFAPAGPTVQTGLFEAA